MLIVVVAEPKAHPKVPEVEQVVAVGAAIQNLWLAAHSMGYGAAWKTGSHAYDAGVKSALGLRAADQIIGFVHIGRPLSKVPDPWGCHPNWADHFKQPLRHIGQLASAAGFQTLPYDFDCER